MPSASGAHHHVAAPCTQQRYDLHSEVQRFSVTVPDDATKSMLSRRMAAASHAPNLQRKRCSTAQQRTKQQRVSSSRTAANELVNVACNNSWPWLNVHIKLGVPRSQKWRWGASYRHCSVPAVHARQARATGRHICAPAGVSAAETPHHSRYTQDIAIRTIAGNGQLRRLITKKTGNHATSVAL